MNILETLKGAKPFLQTYRKERTLVPNICYAITDYVISVYGKCNSFLPGHEAYKLRTDAQSHVMYKLQDLTTERFFGSVAAAKVLGKHHSSITFGDAQEARHLWLDSLIQELENGTN